MSRTASPRYVSRSLRSLWDSTPAVTRLISAGCLTLTAGLFVVAWLVPVAGSVFVCSLQTVLRRRYVWALFTSILYRPLSHLSSVVMVLLETYLGMAYLTEREQDLGSCRFLLWTLLSAGAVNAIFLLEMLLLSAMAGPRFWLDSNQGLWPLLLVCIVLRSEANPREPTSVFGLVYVPNRWYPAVLGGLLSLLSGGIIWNVAAALAVGHAHTFFQLDGRLLDPSLVGILDRGRLSDVLHRLLSLVGNWVPGQHTSGYEDLESAGRRYASLTDFRNASAQRTGADVLDPPLFRGPASAASIQGGAGAPKVVSTAGQRLGR